MIKTIYDFIQNSIKDSLKYMFPGPDGNMPIIDIVRSQYVLYKNRLLEVRIICYCNFKTSDKGYNDSDPIQWNSLFDDILKEFDKSKTDEKSIKTIFHQYGYDVVFEIQITEDKIIFLDNKKIIKKNDKLDKVIDYIKEKPAGKSKNEITQFIKNYKPNDRKEITEYIENSDCIIKTDLKGSSKKGTIVYTFKAEE